MMNEEEHMHDFIDGKNFACDDDFEVDLNYEFDVVSFYDFTRPETMIEIKQAESWFDYADSYPPSPFVIKLLFEKLLASQQSCSSSKRKESQSSNLSISNSESKLANKPAESRSFSYMKPTASLLAKQNKLQEANCKHLRTKHENICLRSPRYGEPLSKRQKLERGYLRKVTVPIEPQLETMLRAERRGSRNTTASSESASSKVHAVKAQSRNRNIDKESSRLSSQKSARQLIKCQVLDAYLEDSVVQSSVASVKSSTLKGVREKQYHQRSPKSNTRPLEEMEYGASNEERLLQNPPIEDFSKLSIKTRS